jgi:TetR/AcrR family transcriptional regulator, cholesterol catabolism regulator
MARHLSRGRPACVVVNEGPPGPTAPSAFSAERAQEMRTRALQVVLTLLEAKGYENVQLAQVAEKAHMSLATIYKYFPSRDELMVAAVELWMDENVYQFEPLTDEPAFEALMRIFRTIFEPWVEHPRILEAFVRARATAQGSRLIAQGQTAVVPLIREVLGNFEPSFVDDLEMIMIHVNSSVYTSVASGQMGIRDVLPTFERTLYRILSTNNDRSKNPAPRRTSRQNRPRSKIIDS